MINIQPQYLSLARLLEGRLFRIPEYQRAYSWQSHQRTDLFEDVERAFLKGAEGGHFMAAVVCLRRRQQRIGVDDFHILEVVDGQQRLTTLIVLLKSIHVELLKADPNSKTCRELGDLLVKAEGDELLLLQTNHDSSHHFANFLRTGEADAPSAANTIADKEILSAIRECHKFVASWAQGGRDLIDLLALIRNRLFFLLHEIDEERAVYTVFEVLNSRGLDVSWFDRMKSILMGIAFELPDIDNDRLVQELHTYYRDIYATIGLRQGLSTIALRFTATLYRSTCPNRPLSEEDAVEELRASAHSAASVRGVAERILEVTRACDEILANPRIQAVARIVQARLLATAIILRKDLSDDARARLLAVWEKTTFRIYGMLSKDARTKVGDYVRLAWRTIQKQLSEEEIADGIRNIGAEFPIDEAIVSFSAPDMYEGWQDELRYFFYRYEEHLAALNKREITNEVWQQIWTASAADSIEHIWPQASAPDDHKHRLGNLVLLSPRLNSRLGARPPVEKANAYRETGLLVAIDVANRIPAGWDEVAIREREQALLDWARVTWND